MDMESILTGGGLFISGAGLKMLLDFITARHNARNQRTEVLPSPLDVRQVADCVSKDDCRERMEKIEARVERTEQRFEETAQRVYNKIDACAEGIAELRGEIRAWRKE